jgi:topoisomerase IA-like protein
VDWNGVKVNVTAEDDVDAIIAKIRAKQENPVRMVGPFQIRTGPYGPYLMRVGGSGVAKSKGATKAQYVSIPKETDLDTLTAQQAGEIFEAGLKAKAKSKYRKN